MMIEISIKLSTFSFYAQSTSIDLLTFILLLKFIVSDLNWNCQLIEKVNSDPIHELQVYQTYQLLLKSSIDDINNFIKSIKFQLIELSTTIHEH